MTQSLWLYAFVPPSEEWQKMADVYFACKRAGISPPPEVEGYFEDGEPDPRGEEVGLKQFTREYSLGDVHWGLEIDTDKIPKNATMLRFYVAA